jgi:hypothetical protein
MIPQPNNLSDISICDYTEATIQQDCPYPTTAAETYLEIGNVRSQFNLQANICTTQPLEGYQTAGIGVVSELGFTRVEVAGTLKSRKQKFPKLIHRYPEEYVSDF